MLEHTEIYALAQCREKPKGNRANKKLWYKYACLGNPRVQRRNRVGQDYLDQLRIFFTVHLFYLCTGDVTLNIN